MYVVCISYLYSYTAEKRDVLGYSSLMIKRFSRAKHDGNLEVRGDAYCINQCIPTRGHSLIINTSLARDVSGNTSIQRDVKINSSPIMTRECFICLVRVAISPKEVFHVLVPGDAGQSEDYTKRAQYPSGCDAGLPFLLAFKDAQGECLVCLARLCLERIRDTL